MFRSPSRRRSLGRATSTVSGWVLRRPSAEPLGAGSARVALGNISEATIAQLVASGASAEELERAMRPLLEKQAEVAAVDRRNHALNSERQRIVSDQERVRENMKALRGSSEEKQLLQRYTRQLDEQESRLAVLQQEMSKADSERAALVAELSRLISTLSFDWTGKPQ